VATIQETIAEEVAKKDTDELQSIVGRPDYWQPALIDAAKTELEKRGVALPASQVMEAKSSAEVQLPPPLTITVTTASEVHRYGERAAGKDPAMVDSAMARTRSALRADILRGVLPRESKTRLVSGSEAKPRVFEGSLYECARKYPDLLELYDPMRRHAQSGLRYGVLFGMALHLLCLGYVMSRTDLFGGDPNLGLAVIALPICWLIAYLDIKGIVKIPALGVASMVALVVLPGYLGLNGGLPPVLGAALSGALLFSAPGAAIGAIVGAVRRPSIPKAFDALTEPVYPWIGIPVAVSILIWALFAHFAPQLLSIDLHR
jgi:hypothetical protein